MVGIGSGVIGYIGKVDKDLPVGSIHMPRACCCACLRIVDMIVSETRINAISERKLIKERTRLNFVLDRRYEDVKVNDVNETVVSSMGSTTVYKWL